jgi:hypothetical protein
MGFGAAPVCSETFTMAEDPKASAVGEKKNMNTTNKFKNMEQVWTCHALPMLTSSCCRHVCHLPPQPSPNMATCKSCSKSHGLLKFERVLHGSLSHLGKFILEVSSMFSYVPVFHHR